MKLKISEPHATKIAWNDLNIAPSSMEMVALDVFDDDQNPDRAHFAGVMVWGIGSEAQRRAEAIVAAVNDLDTDRFAKALWYAMDNRAENVEGRERGITTVHAPAFSSRSVHTTLQEAYDNDQQHLLANLTRDDLVSPPQEIGDDLVQALSAAPVAGNRQSDSLTNALIQSVCSLSLQEAYDKINAVTPSDHSVFIHVVYSWYQSDNRAVRHPEYNLNVVPGFNSSCDRFAGKSLDEVVMAYLDHAARMRVSPAT